MVKNVEVNKAADIKVNNNKGEMKMVTNKQLHQAVKEVQEQSKIEGVAVERELIHLVVGNQEFKVIASDQWLIYKSGEWGEVETVDVNDEEIEFQEYYEIGRFIEYYDEIEDLSVGYIMGELEAMGYSKQEQTTSEEEVEMVNNNEVNVDEVVNNEVNNNNNKGEIQMVNIYEDGKIIGRVNSNRNLDYWDGNNFTHGGVGRHLGLTIRRNGDLVFIYTSQWQGDRDWAEVVTEDEAMQAILRADAIDLLDNPRFKKLKELYLAEYVEADEVEDIEVNNNKQGEMKMGVNKEWIERVEAYVGVKNGRTLASLIYDGTLGKDSWERFTGETVEVEEDIQVGGDWLITLSKVDNLTIGNNPDIKKGLRVYVQNKGDIIEKALYVAVDEDGVIGQEDVIYEMRSYEDVVEAAVNKAGTFIKDWMYYFKVDVSGIGLDDLMEFNKRFTSSKQDSYDTLYTETVEWLMGQIKWTRELEAKQDEDRVYDVDWELYYLDCYETPEVRVADDLNEGHDYYDSLYLSVDDYEYYKELDEAYGVLEDFKENPAKYVGDDWYSSGELKELLDGVEGDVYNKFIDRFKDEDMIVMRRRLESGWCTEFIVKIIKSVVASKMFNYPDSYTEYPKSITETESGTYLSIVFGGYRATVEVESVNYTYQDELWVVSELRDVILGVYEVDEIDGYLQRVPRSK